MRKSMRVLDKILTHVTIIGFLAFMVYACEVVPESPIVPFVAMGVLVYLLWIAADIFFWFNNKRVEKDIQRYIDSGFDPRSVKGRYY